MPYMTPEQEAMQQLLDNTATDPLDLLNKWRAGVVDNDTMFILMQRALLHLRHNSTRMADPVAFAATRKPILPREQQFVNNVIDSIKRVDPHLKFQVSNANYQQLIKLAEMMFNDGLRMGPFIANNIARGRYQMYHNYKGGKAFTDLIDCITDGSNGE